MENSLKKPANFAGKEIEDKTSILHVSGVTVRELQNSLVRAGFDPGAVDGKIGKKTKKAVKDFQKKNSLKADGVVGEKTWALLKAQ
ncbi:MAG: peptidoglycan-binding protein [Candidatus Omnitrophica bacterium]|nr:peptidoglycan-binding protein [Candidatus Omnitrophota bacterium]